MKNKIEITKNAHNHILKVISQDNANYFRISVSGGGCAGFQYSFAFSEDKTEDDILIKQDGITIVTDNISLLYLAGSQIDYKEDLVGSAFSITNPNAKSSCSCGTSFSV